MPILGNLAEFPLPEVLHFIGGRTGRMKLIDVPGADYLELDTHLGYLIGLLSGGVMVEQKEAVVQKLSVVLQVEHGMFEFSLIEESQLRGQMQLPLQSLAMELAFTVDQLNHDSQRLLNPNQSFVLLQDPQIWIDHDLRQFFHYAKDMIHNRASIMEIADLLGMEAALTASHLGKLRMLGFIDLAPDQENIALSLKKRTAQIPQFPLKAKVG